MLAEPRDLRIRRLLPLWWPLAITFLLVSGATPIINASINRLPVLNPSAHLAAFALLLGTAVVLHSPLFVTREIAIKLSVDRAGARRAVRFCLAAAACVAAVDLTLGLTPLGATLLRHFTDRPRVVALAHRALPWISPMPFFIALRGSYQARQIRVDDNVWVALATGCRVTLTGLLGLLAGPRLGIDGARLGALCMSLGIAVEATVTFLRARRKAVPPERAPEGTRRLPLLRFALPLMLANFLGVLASILYLKMAGNVLPSAQTESLAAFQEVRALQWALTAGAMAMQALTTAKVETREDAKALLRFAACVGTGLFGLFALVAFTPVRDFVLVTLLGERPGGPVVARVAPALLFAATIPLLQAFRFCLRGILIARGIPSAIMLSTISGLTLLSLVLGFGWIPSRTNGALSAYSWWNVTLLVEIAILGLTALRERRPLLRLPLPLRSPRESTGG